MNSIEQEYWKRVSAMSGQERVARSLSLFGDITTMIAHKIHRTNSGIHGRELNRQIAMQLYRRDQAVQMLLELAKEHGVEDILGEIRKELL